MIIAQISDTHLDLESPDIDRRIHDFTSVIADINELDPGPDLIVHTGDIVHNGKDSEYQEAIGVLSKAEAPVVAIVGNKDNRGQMQQAFSSFGFLSPDNAFVQFSIDDFPVELIMLDTLNPASNRGEFCAERLTQLTDMLSKDANKPAAVFMHHPPCEIAVGPSPLHFDDLAAMSDLQGLLQQSGRVVSIFCGHVHRSTSGSVGEIPVLVTTAVATPLRWGEYAEHMKTRPTYFLHRYHSDFGFITETRIV